MAAFYEKKPKNRLTATEAARAADPTTPGAANPYRTRNLMGKPFGFGGKTGPSDEELIRQAAQAEVDRLRKRRGWRSTILTSPTGFSGENTLLRKTTLG